MRSRVMPGSLVTMERRVPVKRLKSVDLPTLGRPTITSDGIRAVMNFRCSAIFQSTAFASRFGTGSCRRECIKLHVVVPLFCEPVAGALGEKNGIVVSTPKQVSSIPSAQVHSQILVRIYRSTEVENGRRRRDNHLPKIAERR